MARTDIARVVARAVLEGAMDSVTIVPPVTDGRDVDLSPAIDALLMAAFTVKRRRMQNVGEVVEIVFVVPPDPTTPED